MMKKILFTPLVKTACKMLLLHQLYCKELILIMFLEMGFEQKILICLNFQF